MIHMRKQDNRCVYKHIRLDTNEVFYIGMGTTKRAFQKYKRNIHWKRVVSKTDFKVEIIAKNLSWNVACQLEQKLIKEYNKKFLTNMTDGGDGSIGLSPNKETRKKISDSLLGIKRSTLSRKRMSFAKKDKYLLGDNPNCKKVINTDTKEIFESLKEAASSIDKNYSSFKWSIRHSKNFNFKYL